MKSESDLYRFAVVFFTSMLMAVSMTEAATISLGPLDSTDSSGFSVIRLEGDIEKGDLRKLISFSERDPLFLDRYLLLASDGGDAIEAMKIGSFVKEMYMAVLVNGRVHKCASACFLIYISAVERSTFTGSLGIHRPYFAGSYFAGLSPHAAEARYRELSKQVKAFLIEMETPTYLVDKMFSLASSEIYWLQDEDLKAIGERSPWWDQYMVTRCGLDKRLERESASAIQNPQFWERYRAYAQRLSSCRYGALKEEPRRALERYKALFR